MQRIRALGLAGSAGLCLCAGQALAQSPDGLYGGQPYTGGVLPNLGANSNVETLRPQLERYFNAPTLPATAPAWVVSGGMGVDVGVTDNAGQNGSQQGGARGGQADVFTVLTPFLNVTGDSTRFKTNLSYNPQVQLYAGQGSQNRISQYFNGQSLAIIAPDAAYIDFRGAVTQSSLLGSGFNNGTSSTYNRQNQVQTTSFSVTPYAEHRFGGWGTARIGYSIARTLQDSDSGYVNNNAVNVFGNQVYGNQGYGSIGNLTTQRERASFATGENLGRFNDLTVLEAIQYSGGGSYAGSYRNQATNELGYALNHKVTLLGGLGYQDIRYSGSTVNGLASSAVRISEPTWNTGVRYTPNPDSSMTVLFGRRDGSASVSFDGQFAPTARTRVFGRYSTGITSDIEDAQNLLAATTVGPGGLVTDSATGAPVGSYGGGGFGIQNGVYRVRRLSLSGIFLANRDSYSLGIGQEERTTLTTTASLFTGNTIPSGTSTSSFSISGGWQHDLAPNMTSTLSVQYATTDNTSQLLGSSNGRQDTISVTAAVSRQFTETLSGSVRYTHTDQFGAQGANLSRFNTGNYSQNTLLVGLRKGF